MHEKSIISKLRREDILPFKNLQIQTSQNSHSKRLSYFNINSSSENLAIALANLKKEISQSSPIFNRGSSLLKMNQNKLYQILNFMKFPNNEITQNNMLDPGVRFADHLEVLKILGALDIHTLNQLFTQTENYPSIFIEDFIAAFLQILQGRFKNSDLFYLALGALDMFLNIIQANPLYVDALTKKWVEAKKIQEIIFLESLQKAVKQYNFYLFSFLIEQLPFMSIKFSDFLDYYINPSHIIFYKNIFSETLNTPQDDIQINSRRVKKIDNIKSSDMPHSIQKIVVANPINMLLVCEDKGKEILFYNANNLCKTYTLQTDQNKHKKTYNEILDLCFIEERLLLCASCLDGNLSFWYIDMYYYENLKTKHENESDYILKNLSKSPILNNQEICFQIEENQVALWYSKLKKIMITLSSSNKILCWSLENIKRSGEDELRNWEINVADQNSYKNVSKKNHQDVLHMYPTEEINLNLHGVTGMIEIEKINCFCFSSFEKKLYFWDYDRKNILKIIDLPYTSAHKVIWLPSLSYIIPCCFDKNIVIFEISKTNEISMVGELIGHVLEILIVEVFDDINCIITIDEGNNLRVWSAYTMKSIQFYRLESSSRVIQLIRIRKFRFLIISKHVTVFELVNEENQLGLEASNSGLTLLPQILFDLKNERDAKFILSSKDKIFTFSLSKECLLTVAKPEEWLFKQCKMTCFQSFNLPYYQYAFGDNDGNIYLVPEKSHGMVDKPKILIPFGLSNSDNIVQEGNQTEKHKGKEKIENMHASFLKKKKFDMDRNESNEKKEAIIKNKKYENKNKLFSSSIISNTIDSEKNVASPAKFIILDEKNHLIIVGCARAIAIFFFEKFKSFSKYRYLQLSDSILSNTNAVVQEAQAIEIQEIQFLENFQILVVLLTNDVVLFLDYCSLNVLTTFVNYRIPTLMEIDKLANNTDILPQNKPSESPLPVQQVSNISLNTPSIISFHKLQLTKKESYSYRSTRNLRRVEDFSQALNQSAKIDFQKILNKATFVKSFGAIQGNLCCPDSGRYYFWDDQKNFHIAQPLDSKFNSVRIEVVIDCSIIGYDKSFIFSAKDMYEDYLVFGDIKGLIYILNLSSHLEELIIRKNRNLGFSDPLSKSIKEIYLADLEKMIATSLNQLEFTRASKIGDYNYYKEKKLDMKDVMLLKGHEENVEVIKIQKIYQKLYLFILSEGNFLRVLNFDEIRKNFNERKDFTKLISGNVQKLCLIEIDFNLLKINKWEHHLFWAEWMNFQVAVLKEIFTEIERILVLLISKKELTLQLPEFDPQNHKSTHLLSSSNKSQVPVIEDERNKKSTRTNNSIDFMNYANYEISREPTPSYHHSTLNDITIQHKQLPIQEEAKKSADEASTKNKLQREPRVQNIIKEITHLKTEYLHESVEKNNSKSKKRKSKKKKINLVPIKVKKIDKNRVTPEKKKTQNYIKYYYSSKIKDTSLSLANANSVSMNSNNFTTIKDHDIQPIYLKSIKKNFLNDLAQKQFKSKFFKIKPNLLEF